MLILCPNCKQHYDERAQSKKCDGFRGHQHTGTTAIAEHRYNVTESKAARARRKARQRPGTAPTDDATASGGTDTHPTTKDA